MEVKFVDFGKQYRKYQKEIDDAISVCLHNGQLILRRKVDEFEQELAKFVGTKYAVGVNSGTDALFLSLKMAGVGPGDEVITVGHTFHATVEAIVRCGAQPILVGVDESSLMDLSELSEFITPKTKAIIPVHLMGDMVDVQTIKEMWPKIKIIEDACQALGASIVGRKAGSFGDFGCFSFYPAKILGAFGDAGAIVTNNEDAASELKDLRNHYKYNPGKYGYNSRLDNLQAAILLVKLGHIDEILAKRADIAKMYDKGLKGVILPRQRDGRVYQDYIIRIELRDDLSRFLKVYGGVETMKNDYHFPDDLPKPTDTVLLEKKTLRLPCNDVLEPEEIQYVIGLINRFTQGNGLS